MAFTPFKNRKIEEPERVQEEASENNNVANSAPSSNANIYMAKPIVANSNIPGDIPATPLVIADNNAANSNNAANAVVDNTANSNVASNNAAAPKPAFNIALLEATDLASVLLSFGASKVRDNLYKVKDYEISIKDNKWYNTHANIRKGNINAISLTKHLIAYKENINEYENQKPLFIAACKKLSGVREQLKNDAIAALNEEEKKQEQLELAQKNPSPAVVQENSQPAETPSVVSTEDSKGIAKSNIEQTKKRFGGNVPVVNNNNSTPNWKAINDQLSNIPLSDVLEFVGANPNEDGQRGKWKVWDTADNVHVTGNKWHSWKAQKGGIGALTFMTFFLSETMSIDDRDDENRKKLWKMARQKLMKEFGGSLDMYVSPETIEEDFKKPFSMPHIVDFKINNVRRYLHHKRGLPLWIIDKQIKTGTLFAGHPSDWPNEVDIKNPQLGDEYVWATFLGTNGTAAEMRGIERTDKLAKILATGSAKEFGGFSLKAEKDCNEKTVAVLEAAIDCMSYHSFFPGRIATSCMGVTFKLAVKIALESLERNYNFQFAFDNDLAGNESAVRFKESLIDEIGEEEYKGYMDNNKINYFDLGIKCLIQTVKQGKTFYFDVQNNEIGKKAVLMFQEQWLKVTKRETINEIIRQERVKFINVCPNFSMSGDPQKEVENVINLLNSGKPYYLRIIIDDDEKPDVAAKREAFETALQNIAKDKIPQWEKEGKIIYNKQALAKDWNEFYLVMKKDPRFQEKIAKQEKDYAHYSESEDKTPTKKNNP